MTPENPFLNPPFVDLFRTLLPDWVLAFAFFTALSYAVLGRRFGRQKPAAAMSAALGMALAIGLVWWEYDNGWSIRDLGPLAIGFAVLMLCVVTFHAIHRVGGSWAGAGIAIGTTIIVAWILGIQWPVDSEIIQTIAVVALIVGCLSFLFHLHRTGSRPHFLPNTYRKEVADIRHDMFDLNRGRHLGKKLRQGLKQVRRKTDRITDNPRERTDVLLQIRRILPAEGWLTERMVQLREKAHHVRKGHISRIEELRYVMNNSPRKTRKQASRELAARYKELQLDQRLERLEKAVALNERHIKELTQEAQKTVARFDFRKVDGLLKTAEKLQSHNVKLIKVIERTEQKLVRIVQKIAGPAGKVNDG